MGSQQKRWNGGLQVPTHREADVEDIVVYADGSSKEKRRLQVMLMQRDGCHARLQHHTTAIRTPTAALRGKDAGRVLVQDDQEEPKLRTHAGRNYADLQQQLLSSRATAEVTFNVE